MASKLHAMVCLTLRFRKPIVAIVTLALILTVSTLVYEQYLASASQPPEAYPQLSLDVYQRLLVVAPHADDEVLGAAGLIQAALREGLDVRVVIATNGDGHPVAALEQGHRRLPNGEDYVALGELRQRESLLALARLGVPADAIAFLGYPDRGLASLWWSHWESDLPYRSPQSRQDRSPYPVSYHAEAPYSGESLLQDLCDILLTYHPDLIVGPHPNDDHDDHRALSAMIALAIELERYQDPEFSPLLLTYLVHYGLYPQPRGLRLQASLRPPRQLDAVAEWVQWPLTQEDVDAKRDAVAAYRSQVRLRPEYLYSFVRRNELFAVMETATELSPIQVESFVDVNSVPIVSDLPALLAHDDPTGDRVLRSLRRGADIEEIRVLRLGDNVWVAVSLRGRVSTTCTYLLRLRTFTATGAPTIVARLERSRAEGVLEGKQTIWFRLDHEELGNPDWVALAVETYQGVTLDRTAWYLLRLADWPWDDEEKLSPSAAQAG